MEPEIVQSTLTTNFFLNFLTQLYNADVRTQRCGKFGENIKYDVGKLGFSTRTTYKSVPR